MSSIDIVKSTKIKAFIEKIFGNLMVKKAIISDAKFSLFSINISF